MVMAMPAVTTTLALTREKEHGTLEQLIATPIRRSELLVGKLMPYVLSGLLGVVLCAAVAVYWFGSPFRGSFALYLVLSVDFLLASLAIALVMSVFVKTQQAAQLGAMLIFFFPGFFLSGIFYPAGQHAADDEDGGLYGADDPFRADQPGDLSQRDRDWRRCGPYALALLVMGGRCSLALAILLFQEKAGIGDGDRA